MLEVGGVVARLGARLDDDAFDRFDRRLDKARREARDGAEAKLKADVDTRGFDRYDRRLRDVDDSHERVGRSGARMGGVLRGGAMLVGGATVALGGLAAGAKSVVGAFEESEVTARRQALVIKTMGQDAGASAEHVTKLADALARKTGVDDDAIIAGANVVRTFKAIRNETGANNDIFDRATKAALDMSAAMGTDLQAASIQLGKALNDPAKGAAALSRTGTIAKADLEQLKKMAEDGAPILEQQRFVLEKIEEQFAGTAESSATESAKMRTTFGELAESVGEKVAPAFNRAVGGIRRFTDGIRDGEGAGGRFANRVRGLGRDVGSAFRSIREAARDAFGYVRSIIDENSDTLGTMGRSIGRLWDTAKRALTGIRGAFEDTFGGGSGASRDVRSFIRAILDIADAALKILAVVARRALPGIVTAFRGLFQMVRGVIRLITGVLTGDFGKAWDGVKDIFSGGVKAVAGLLRAATAPFRAAAAGIGRAIGGAFSSAWDAVVSTAQGFVNRIIDVINLIPGVDIKPIGGRQTAERKPGSTANARRRELGFARGGFFERTGGYMDRPVAIGGEEAPEHSEWVIPENPAYRPRAVGLWRAAGRALGVPGFAKGGLVEFVKSLPGKALDTAGNLASSIVDKLPSAPGGILGGAFEWALDKARDYITDKAGDLFRSLSSAVGIGERGPSGMTGAGTMTGTNAKAARLAAMFGASITSGYRSPAHNAAVGGAPGSSHMKGSPANPGAHDFVPASAGLLAAALKMGAKWVDNHDFGSGLHSHVSWFARGGKRKGKAPAPKLSATANRGIKRSVSRGEAGLKPYEDAIRDLEREYDQANRRADLDPNEFLVEQDDGSVTVDDAAFRDRVGELEGLERKRAQIHAKVKAYRAAVERAVKAYTSGIGRLRRALGAAKGKARKKERGGYRERIAEYTERRGELTRVGKDLGFDLEDATIDLGELRNEITAIRDPSGRAIGARAADPVDAPPEDDAPDDAPPAAPDPAEVAAQAIAQVAAFQAERADVFGSYGANFARGAGGAPLAGVGAQAAGTRFYGGATGGADTGVLDAAGAIPSAGETRIAEVTQHLHFTGPQPVDPHTLTQAALHELKAAL